MGILHHGSESSSSSSSNSSSTGSESICLPIPASEYNAAPITNSWTLQHMMIVVAAVIGVLTLILSFGLAALHLANYTNAPQQRLLVRIVVTPALLAIFSFLSLCFYDASYYIEPIGAFYECFALVALFYYMVILVTPHEKKEEFFDQLELRTKRGTAPGGSLAWFRKRWIMVFQIIPIRLITMIAIWAITATFCHTEKKFDTAHTVINVINAIPTALCLVALLQVHRRLKEELQGNGVMFKLISLKLIVALQILQRIIFTALTQNNVIKSSTYISTMDWEEGIPNFIVVCETFIFSILFLFSYSWKPFTSSKAESGYGPQKWSFIKALIHVLNISDMIGGVLEVIRSKKLAKKQNEGYLPPAYQEESTSYSHNYSR